MALNRQVNDGYVGGSEQNNSSEDQLTGIFALRRKELEVMIIDTVRKAVVPVLEPLIREVMPLIREVVKKEIELAPEKILTNMKRNSGNEMHPSEPRSLQLHFSNKLSLPILTGKKIREEGGTSIQVALVDGLTRKVVNFGPEASAKVEIVVLGGDFDGDEKHDWTLEEFNQKIVREREGNKSLLTGNVFLNLKDGIGYVDEISFTHNRNWMKRCQFRLGARVMDNLNGTRVREAMTECFFVEDRRSKYYKKCDSPSLSDEVWRLKNICKNGAFHKRLMGKKIETVKDFLTQFFINPGGLQEILGTSMSTGKWAVTVDHAQRCKLDNKKYKYCPPISQQNTEVVFDVVGRVMGLLSQQCHFVSIDQLSEKEKADARKLVLSPYEHRDRVVPIDETSLVHGASCSSNALAPSNSPMLESPKASNIETSHMLNGHDHTQTAISTPGIISSNNFVEDMCNLYSFGPCSFSNSEPIVEPSSGTFLVSNSPNCDLESMSRDCDDYLCLSQWFNFGNPTPESYACQQSAASGDPLVGTQTVTIDKKAQQKWTTLRTAVFFCLLRWSSERKFVAPESNHVQKKQRIC